MKKYILLVFLIVSGIVSAGIPDPSMYQWGTIEVPENYRQPGGRKLKISWEKLVSTSENPKAIIFINGGPGLPHDSFHRQNANGGLEKDFFHNLRSDFDVYYFDQRGNGNSSPISFAGLSKVDITQYGTKNICRDIEELRTQVIKKDRIAVCGESYGGMVALTYATMFPNSLSHLVIHDSSPSNCYFTHLYQNFSNMLVTLDKNVFPGLRANFIKTLTKLDEGKITTVNNAQLSRSQFLAMCMSFTYSFRGQTILNLMVKDLANSGQSKVLNSILSVQQDSGSGNGIQPTLLLIQGREMLDEVVINALKSASEYAPWSFAWAQEILFEPRRNFNKEVNLTGFDRYNVMPKLGLIKVPTLIVVGKYDFVCPPRYAYAMQKGIGESCSLFEIDQCAHGGFVEKNELTVSRIHMFLLGVAGSIHNADSNHTEPLEAIRKKNFRTKEVIDSYIEGTRNLRSLLNFP